MINTIHGRKFCLAFLKAPFWGHYFSICLYAFFLFRNGIDVTSDTDDNTPYARPSKINLAIEKSELCSENIFSWFQNNGMKGNGDKCRFLVYNKVCRINNVAYKFKMKINEIDLESSPDEILLGTILDDHLNFKSYTSNLSKNAGQKFNALARISYFMDLPKFRVIMKAYVNLQSAFWLPVSLDDA